MSPFIKYTKRSQHAKGAKEEVIFINTQFIAQAVYDDAAKSLKLVVNADPMALKPVTINNPVEITGDEAVEAMEKIRDLT